MIYQAIKRILDFLLALLLLPLVLLLIAIQAIWIKAEDGGPVFFVSRRTGRYGKPFNMYKLRSMVVDAPDIRLEDGSTYSAADDPRMTSFGKFARKTSLDEIPQIFNILKGDMSFIGPRPDSASYLDSYTEEERKMLEVRPGITGYNQAINRNAVLTKEKLKNDVYYVENISFWFDIKILFWTVKSTLTRKNIYREHEISDDGERA